MYLFLLILLLLAGCSKPYEFTENKEVTIYRDQWGVPHIHGLTDEDVAYGLAWVSCEDDFITIQEQLLAVKGNLGQVKGRDGALADFAIQFMGIRDYARRNMHTLSDATQKLIRGYVNGANAYILAHPESVLSSTIYPIEDYDLVTGYLMGMVEISGASSDLRKLADGSIVKELHTGLEKGSNAIAISARITDERETFLAVNSHQPMEGWYSWYEAHLVSDEGMNILGGTFPGGATIFHGVNEYLGWAQTVNHADFSDIYKLVMHPEKKFYYEMDGDYFPLKRKVIRAWVKLWGPIQIPITRNIYESKFGITFRIGEDFYAWRYQAREAVKSIEQWYAMNRARNFDEFKAALNINGIACTNIVYADAADNIYYISNGIQPKRSPEYNWQSVLPGNTRKTLWTDEYWPVDSLPQVLNPSSGYVFNTNNTPFSSSADDENPVYEERFGPMGYKHPCEENNRSLRLQELLDGNSHLSYREFLNIKFDQTYPISLRADPYDEETLLQLDPLTHDSIRTAIDILASWDRNTNKENRGAALFLLARERLRLSYIRNGQVEDQDYAGAISKAGQELLAKFGRMDVPLGEIQRHRRADVDLPLGGGSDVLAAIYCREDDDGRYRAFSGESYIMMARFGENELPVLETINAYGARNLSDNPHYTDQMQLFVNQQLKSMTLDMDVVKAAAVEQYHPLMVLQ